MLNFLDFNEVKIKLIDPKDRAIRETSEDFIRIFLKGALLKIKDSNPDLDLEYEHYKNSNLIERIKISNLNINKIIFLHQKLYIKFQLNIIIKP